MTDLPAQDEGEGYAELSIRLSAVSGDLPAATVTEVCASSTKPSANRTGRVSLPPLIPRCERRCSGDL